MQTFNELELNPSLMRAIAELGYEKPTPIQAEALPILLGEPTDFLGLATTGTGKTAAFAIPLLSRIDPAKRKVQALVLCPTRELALQVAGQIDLLGKHLGVRALPIYGGAGYGDQISGLKRGAMVVVGTPGRVVDHIEKGTLNLEELHTLVLDEADEMISMGFKEDLETILGSVPPGSASKWLFSATMSREVRRVADEYLNEPQQVQVNKTEMLPDTVEQLYYMTQESNKPEILCKLIDAAAGEFYGLIFCQTKSLVIDLTQYLNGRGYRSDCLHGDMDQNARERAMRAFREKRVTMMVCTDVASRGLDVKDITHVINYSIPRELDNYVHRIGRTARSGKTGFAMSLVTPSHRPLIGRIERMTKSRMQEGKIPTRKEIGALKIARILETFQAQTGAERAIELMGESWKTAVGQMSTDEIAGRFLTLMFPEIFAQTRDEPAQPEYTRGASVTSVTPGGGTGRVVKAAVSRPRSTGPAIVVAPLAQPMALAPIPEQMPVMEPQSVQAPAAVPSAKVKKQTPPPAPVKVQAESAPAPEGSPAPLLSLPLDDEEAERALEAMEIADAAMAKVTKVTKPGVAKKPAVEKAVFAKPTMVKPAMGKPAIVKSAKDGTPFLPKREFGGAKPKPEWRARREETRGFGEGRPAFGAGAGGGLRAERSPWKKAPPKPHRKGQGSGVIKGTVRQAGFAAGSGGEDRPRRFGEPAAGSAPRFDRKPKSSWEQPLRRS